MSSSKSSKQRVAYFYDSDIGNYYYGQGHPMKPHRIRMAHNLLLSYGLYRKMEIYRPAPATFEELIKFHSEDYVRFLKTNSPENMAEHTKQMQRFNVGEDSPVFDGLYQFCQVRSVCALGHALATACAHAPRDVSARLCTLVHACARSDASARGCTGELWWLDRRSREAEQGAGGRGDQLGRWAAPRQEM